MVTIYIDGQPYEVEAGQNVLHVALSLGFDLPYFCWHPAMGSVGACRQCAVKQFKDENDTKGKLVMACMTPAADAARFSIQDAEAHDFRQSVIEWLMVNHPHDCPVCDEGGECHLQDMTQMTGHTCREYRFDKRTYRNQYLGPFVNHEMNRCIACYRCVRYYRGIAGGRDLDVFGIHDHVYFGRHEDGVLESEFSGNLVEICPTGVFTDRTLKKHYTRKWDLQTAPSVCVQCSLGCNTIPGERYNALRRIRNRYSGQVNGYFLCDRGRYGYEFVNSERRIRRALVLNKVGEKVEAERDDAAARHGAGPSGLALHEVDRETALRAAAQALHGARGIAGIGSPRASLEANFALRELVGPERFCLGMGQGEQELVELALEILRSGPARTPSLREIETADAVLVLGEDVTNTAPVLDLALRQTVRQQPMQKLGKLQIHLWDDAAVREAIQDVKGPFYIASTHAVKLDAVATASYRAAPEDIARLGMAVARAIDGSAPKVSHLDDEIKGLAAEIAKALHGAQRPLVVSGTGAGSAAVLKAAANVAWALCQAGQPCGLALVVPEANSLGLAMMGGRPVEDALDALIAGSADTVVILENDLYRRAPKATVDAALAVARNVIVVDHLVNRTVEQATVVLPAATFAESDGTLVNNEGRAQRFFQVFVPEGDVQESWRWLRDLALAEGLLRSARNDGGAEGLLRSARNDKDAARSDGMAGWSNLDDVIDALAAVLPAFGLVAGVAPGSDFRLVEQKVPRKPKRYSGRTAMDAALDVSEPMPPGDLDSPLAFTMEGFQGMPPSALIPRFWAPHWNSIQALNKFQVEVGGPLRGGDPGKRLIEPQPGVQVRFYPDVPAAWKSEAAATPGRLAAVVAPIHHIFGSEELSLLTPGIAELAPQPYAALSPADAAALQVDEGDLVRTTVSGVAVDLVVRLLKGLPQGLVGLPVGLPQWPSAVQPGEPITLTALTRNSL